MLLPFSLREEGMITRPTSLKSLLVHAETRPTSKFFVAKDYIAVEGLTDKYGLQCIQN